MNDRDELIDVDLHLAVVDHGDENEPVNTDLYLDVLYDRDELIDDDLYQDVVDDRDYLIYVDLYLDDVDDRDELTDVDLYLDVVDDGDELVDICDLLVHERLQILGSLHQPEKVASLAKCAIARVAARELKTKNRKKVNHKFIHICHTVCIVCSRSRKRLLKINKIVKINSAILKH